MELKRTTLLFAILGGKWFGNLEMERLYFPNKSFCLLFPYRLMLNKKSCPSSVHYVLLIYFLLRPNEKNFPRESLWEIAHFCTVIKVNWCNHLEEMSANNYMRIIKVQRKRVAKKNIVPLFVFLDREDVLHFH